MKEKIQTDNTNKNKIINKQKMLACKKMNTVFCMFFLQNHFKLILEASVNDDLRYFQPLKRTWLLKQRKKK